MTLLGTGGIKVGFFDIHENVFDLPDLQGCGSGAFILNLAYRNSLIFR